MSQLVSSQDMTPLGIQLQARHHQHFDVNQHHVPFSIDMDEAVAIRVSRLDQHFKVKNLAKIQLRLKRGNA